MTDSIHQLADFSKDPIFRAERATMPAKRRRAHSFATGASQGAASAGIFGSTEYLWRARCETLRAACLDLCGGDWVTGRPAAMPQE